MNKQKVKRVLFLTITNFTVVSIFVAMVLLMPLVFIYSNKVDNSLSDKFMGNKSPFQGIITLWNVDTFEGGTMARNVFLEQVAVDFEKQNKGVFVKVENLTLDQFKANLNMGKVPDIFTYGTGVAGFLEQYMRPLTLNENNFMANFYSSGVKGGKLLAAPWAFGGYALITTQERLDKLDLTYQGKIKGVALSLMQDIQQKKRVKHIYSLTFGGNQFVNSVDAFARVFSQGVSELVQKGVVDAMYANQTTYQAYVNFISGNANCLLGTTRDVARMQNRLKAGKESSVYYEIVSEYTDLVCYASVTTQNVQIQSLCNAYISLLVSHKMQERINRLGLFSPLNIKVYKEDILYSSFERVFSEQTVIKNIFL